MFDPSKNLRKILGKGIQAPRIWNGIKTRNDWDGDGIPNFRDCQPRNPIRQDWKENTKGGWDYIPNKNDVFYGRKPEYYPEGIMPDVSSYDKRKPEEVKRFTVKVPKSEMSHYKSTYSDSTRGGKYARSAITSAMRMQYPEYAVIHLLQRTRIGEDNDNYMYDIVAAVKPRETTFDRETQLKRRMVNQL